MKDIEVERLVIEKAQIEVLIEKHRPRTPKTPEEVNRSGTGKNARVNGQEGNKKEKPPYKKATKDIQIKTSHKKGKEAENTERGNTDILLGDPSAKTAAKFFCLFLLWLCINILRDFAECCESVPLDRSGSYISIRINIYN